MYPEAFVERFWSKVEKRGDDDCWPWVASFAGKGYGQIKIPGTRKNTYAHRVAYELFHGPLEGKQVCHRCDNPKCCNPKHLFAGTSHDNHMDMVVKGRSTRTTTRVRKKLTDEDVKLVRKLRDVLTQEQISRVVGVHQVHVGRILNGSRRLENISSE